MFEAELCNQIFNIFKENDAKFVEKHGFINPTLIKPSGHPSREISQDICDEVLRFFKNDVLSFLKSLEKHSNELTNSLNFDLHEIYNNTIRESKEIIETGDLIVEKLPKNTAKLIKEIFRYVLWPLISESYFVRRGLMKPHGYPGDYVIIEDMYDGNAKSAGMGYIYDTIFLQTQLCQGLRNRKDHMKHILSNYLNQKKGNDLVLFNIGCGGSRELREISIPDDGKGIVVYLMDFDQAALNYSVTSLQQTNSKASLVPLKTNVLELIENETADKLKIERCDLIYSIGLFDYLPDRVLLKLLKTLLTLLKQDGLLVFAHKDYTYYNPRIADWFCDWQYYHRTQKDFEEICKALNVSMEKVSFSREKDGYIFFVQIRNPLICQNI